MQTKEKWNKKYRHRLQQSETITPNENLQRLERFLQGGTALDIACGLGRNSLYLAKQNYSVTSYDISEVAINHLCQRAEQENLPITAKVSDLANINEFTKNLTKTFDLIVNTYYLDRKLFPLIETKLKTGGYFFMETYYQSPEANKTIANKYKLEPQELLNQFGNWEVIHFAEDAKLGIQTILCRK